MAIELPKEWAGLLKGLTGMDFPQANEDSLRAVSHEYKEVAEKFGQLEELLRQVVQQAQQDFEGATADAFVAYASQFVGGENSLLGGAGKDAEVLAENAYETAADIEYTKWSIFGQLALLVVQIALAQALSIPTAGLSEIWAAAAMGAFRVAAIMFLKFLLAQIVMQVLIGIVGGLLLDSILQLTQMGQGNRKEWNTKFTLTAVEFGLIGGVLGGPFAVLGSGFGKLLGNLGGKGLGKLLGNEAGKTLSKGLAQGLGPGVAKGLGKGAAGAGAGAAGKGAAGAGAGAAGKGAAGAGAGAIAKGAAGAGAGEVGKKIVNHGITAEAARNLGKNLGNVLGRTTESLGQAGAKGARGTAANAVGKAVVNDFSKAFEKHLGDALGKETAKNLGREYGETFVKNWAGKADWKGLTHALDDTLKPYVDKLGTAGARTFSHELPESLVHTVGKNFQGSLGYRIGDMIGGSAVDAGHMAVTEGLYNLIFGPDHQFTVSGFTPIAGMASGVLGRVLGHGFEGLRNLGHSGSSPELHPPGAGLDGGAGPAPRPDGAAPPTVPETSSGPGSTTESGTAPESGTGSEPGSGSTPESGPGSGSRADTESGSGREWRNSSDSDTSGETSPRPDSSTRSADSSASASESRSAPETTGGPGSRDEASGSGQDFLANGPKGDSSANPGDDSGRFTPDRDLGDSAGDGAGDGTGDKGRNASPEPVPVNQPLAPVTADPSRAGGTAAANPSSQPGTSQPGAANPGTFRHAPPPNNAPAPSGGPSAPDQRAHPSPPPPASHRTASDGPASLREPAPGVGTGARPDPGPGGTSADAGGRRNGAGSAVPTVSSEATSHSSRFDADDLPPVPTLDLPGSAARSETPDRTAVLDEVETALAKGDTDEALRRLDRLSELESQDREMIEDARGRFPVDPDDPDPFRAAPEVAEALALAITAGRHADVPDLTRPVRAYEAEQQTKRDRHEAWLRDEDADSGTGPPRSEEDLLQERLDRLRATDGDAGSDARLDERLQRLQYGEGSHTPARAARVEELRREYRRALSEERAEGGEDGRTPPGRPATESGSAPRRDAEAGDDAAVERLIAQLDEADARSGPRPDDGSTRSTPPAEDLDLPAPPTYDPSHPRSTADTDTGPDRPGTPQPRPTAGEAGPLLDELPFARVDDLAGMDDPEPGWPAPTPESDLPTAPRFPKIPDASTGPGAELAARVRSSLGHLEADARRVGMDGAERRELSGRVKDDTAAGRYRQAADGLRELRNAVAEHGLGERMRSFRKHVDGGYERASELGMRRSEWFKAALDIESSALTAEPRRTTSLLDAYENRLGRLSAELAARGEDGPGSTRPEPTGRDTGMDAVERFLSDGRLQREETLGMPPERSEYWAERRRSAATEQEDARLLTEYEAELGRLGVDQRLRSLRDLGVAPPELAAWEQRFERHGVTDELSAQHDRRTNHLRDDADLADLQQRLDDLRLRDGADPAETPEPGPRREADPEPEGGRDRQAAEDAWNATEAKWIADRQEELGMPQDERQQWQRDRTAASDEETRDRVDLAHIERLTELARDRRVRELAENEPTGAERTPEERTEWTRRFDEAGGEPETTRRLLDEHDAQTTTLREAEQARLDRELRAPDPLRSLDQRIDQALDGLPKSVRDQASRDSATLTERLRRLRAGDSSEPEPLAPDTRRGGPGDAGDPPRRESARPPAPEHTGQPGSGPTDAPPAQAPLPGTSPTADPPSAPPRTGPADSGDTARTTGPARPVTSSDGEPNRTTTDQDTRARGQDPLPSPEEETRQDSGPETVSEDQRPDTESAPEEILSEETPPQDTEDGQHGQDTPDVSERPEPDVTRLADDPTAPPPQEDSALLADERDTALGALSATEYERLLYLARQRTPGASDEQARDEAYAYLSRPAEPVVRTADGPGERKVELKRNPEPPEWGPNDLAKFDDEAALPRSLKGFGHSKVTFRGLDLLADELQRTFRPTAGGLEELKRELTDNPHTFLAGRDFEFRTPDGGYRQLHIKVGNYGTWSRYAEPSEIAAAPETIATEPTTDQAAAPTVTDATTTPPTTTPPTTAALKEATKAAEPEADPEANLTKIDTEVRSRPGAGDTKSLGASRTFAVSVPLGPAVGTVSPYGSLSFNLRRMEPGYAYSTESRAQTSMTAVGKDGSHVHADDLFVTVESKSWDAKKAELSASDALWNHDVPPTATFSVTGGILWRAPDSITHPVHPVRMPPEITIAQGDRPRLYAPLDVDPGDHLLRWALEAYPEAGPGTDARRQLVQFFEAESLRTLIGPASTGAALSPPLYADAARTRSLGAVELRLEPRSATLRLASDMSEVKKADADRGTATIEHRNTQGGGAGLSIGPTISPMGPTEPLKVQLAAAYARSSQRAESSVGGSTAESGRTLNSRGHAGFYDVRYRVEVRRFGGEWQSPHPQGQDAHIEASLLMSRGEARRLAGWDDDTTLAEGTPEPTAPGYLTEHAPKTFGAHAVVDLGSAPKRDSLTDPATDPATQPTAAPATAPRTRSLVERLRDQVQSGLSRTYPDLVLPPGRHTPEQWRYRTDQHAPGTDGQGAASVLKKRPGGTEQDYNTALRNTHKLHQALSQVRVESALERLTTTGLPIVLERLGRSYDDNAGVLFKSYVTVNLRATATGRRFDGVQQDLGLATNVASTRRADSSTTRTHGWTAGLDAGLSGIKGLGGTAGAGWRYGRQTSYGASYGPLVMPDGGITSAGPQHLWTYDLKFEATATHFRRPRQLARVLTGQLLSMSRFVFRADTPVDLLGPDPAGLAGQVTLAVPAALSNPAISVPRPRHAGAVEQPPDRVEAMPADRAEQLSSGRPVTDWTPHPLFERPHIVQNVTSPQVLHRHLKELLSEVSDQSWVYGLDGTPAGLTLAESFAVGRNEADFSDAAQTGKHVGELFGKTAFTDVTASVSAWPQIQRPRVVSVVDSGDLSLSVTGSAMTGAGHSVTDTTSNTLALSAAFRAKHTDAHQTSGTYGLNWTPLQRVRTTAETTALAAIPTNTTQYSGPLALVSADVDWHLAARSRPTGMIAPSASFAYGRRPPQGRTVHVPDGVMMWMPLHEAKAAGLYDDGLGGQPQEQRYTASELAPLASFPVGRLDMAGALDAFAAHVRRELPGQADWINPSSILEDQLGSLARLGTTLSPEGVRGLMATMEHGGASLRLARNNLGPAKSARLIMTLHRGELSNATLRHDLQPTAAKPTFSSETLSQKLSRGSDAGYKFSESPAIEGRQGVESASAGLDDRGGAARSTAVAHTANDSVTSSVAWEGPVVTGTTRFSLSIELEIGGTRPLPPFRHDVGEIEEHLPLSLARPLADGDTRPPAPMPLAPDPLGSRPRLLRG
ncbi:WXG100-like domain-containing protein, partial [Streptomyces sp. H27-D2]|uniref:WXG100-like domain-containing protein n=1 Tax=Streptomyces sp. H27-D2 TaxID=3046304 RepID=UPI002DB87431